ncbi:MAG: pantetheine-phosphate adenylyltransferase [Candidatus Marisimplicoccus sp.]|tara:strand:+ start:209 stop:664 length:456 start_codon:yes stop_codon:yes gene_type:complete
MKIAVFPGSFDPITLGHVDIIKRSLKLFDKIIIGIGENKDKKYMFSSAKRTEFVYETFQNEKNIVVIPYEGLTVNFCKKNDAKFIIRGLRNPADFEFEKSIALTNRKINNDVETVFVLTSKEYSFISSSIVRDLIKNNGDFKLFIPKGITI